YVYVVTEVKDPGNKVTVYQRETITLEGSGGENSFSHEWDIPNTGIVTGNSKKPTIEITAVGEGTTTIIHSWKEDLPIIGHWSYSETFTVTVKPAPTYQVDVAVQLDGAEEGAIAPLVVKDVTDPDTQPPKYSAVRGHVE